jgi:glycosyltransferase involved in cell wall biosynthesis
LRNQTLSRDLWALRLFDNASTNGVPAGMDLSWHPDARVIPAPKLGVTHARRLAFAHAAEIGAEVILFVDDDNLLDPDYLETGLGIGHADPRLGCWGGQMVGEYGAPAPDWLGRFEKYLAVSRVERAVVCEGMPKSFDDLPPSAGMFSRVAAAVDYVEAYELHPLRIHLGVSGDGQTRGEDTDFVLHALSRGWRVGRFPELRLTHLIPAGRLTADYMGRLLEGVAAGLVLNAEIYGLPKPYPGLLRRWIHRLRIRRLPQPERTFAQGEAEGIERGIRLVRAYRSGIHR